MKSKISNLVARSTAGSQVTDLAPSSFEVTAIDWKFVGRDWMAFLPKHNPGLGFLRDDEFQILCAELANEMPETCFERISSFLGMHRHELWNIDSGGDDYTLVIAPAGKGEALCRQAASGLPEDVRDVVTFEQLAPQATKARKRTAKSKTITKNPPIEVTDDFHENIGGAWRSAVRFLVLNSEDEDGQICESLVDLQIFPMAGIEDEGFFALASANRHLAPVHYTGDAQYWFLTKPQKRQKFYDDNLIGLALIRDYNIPLVEEVEHTIRRAGDNLHIAGFGAALFQIVRWRHDASWLDSSVPNIGPEAISTGERAALLRIVGTRTFHVANLCPSMLMVPASETAVLLHENPTEPAESNTAGDGPRFWLFDCENRLVSAMGHLPLDRQRYGPSLFMLSPEELIFVRTTSKPHPTVSGLFERTAWLVRFNIHTCQWRQAKLDGFHDDYVTNTAILRGQKPDRHRIRSFEGGITIERGEGDWLILNYLTPMPGKHDIAWFWNTQTDEVVRLAQSDFPDRDVSFYWNATLGRYVADESCRLSLLPAFEDFSDQRKAANLVWNDGS